ncbi:AHH domain-containing protein [Mucilaginibacter sp. BT774]|uniref:AHH domain-containing protein n=1 Tax=Mucilaginibacter sp. BT774 TaxID=3062276 RepID=UPI00267483E8|nr:AHH domain-containing protein [Mucilaginibacter sp. BT774]MDO3628862.1 AHH domain-containing protein [Mucilaginibacter sp. BT774]
MKRFLYFLLLTALLTGSSWLKAFAGIEPYENFIKGKVKRNDTLLVKDEKFKNSKFNWSDITNISVKNSISFRVTDQAFIKKDFSCTVYLKIEYLTNPQQQVPEVKKATLKINYSSKKNATYKIVDNYTFTGAYWVKVTVENIYSPEFGNDLPAALLLSNQIVIDRTYHFDPHVKVRPNAQLVKNSASSGTTKKTSSPSLKSSLLSSTKQSLLADGLSAGSTGLVNTSNQLQLTWQIVPGAEYDVEWTTADAGNDNINIIRQMAAGTAGTVDPATLNHIFLNNATRVTIAGQNYLLSLPYNDDYVLVRMRQVQYSTDGIRLLGDWNYTLDNGQYAIWSINWHQQNLNWQYSAAFAEEGKKKEVVSYFDGTLRGRQTVTINNSDNVPVVQENVYDEFGRATASILPAPFKESSGVAPYLRYIQNYNVNSANTPYSASNVTGTGGTCEVVPDPLNTNSGASKYYSAQNAFINDKSYNSYIPDAEGYPLSVTSYTADNTGRIKLQGGIGKAFQPGSSFPSNTTKYFYGKPEQWELDQLFGNDVGFASHYMKNMVVDPNGQISISYLNASGKTIATALTGGAPSGMTALPSQTPVVNKTTNLLDPDKFVFNSSALKITATTTYLASVSGDATLSYSIDKLIDHYSGGVAPLCSNCYYDLTITVRNDCNASIYTTTTPIQVGSATSDCNATGQQTGTLNLNFPAIGEYYVTFDLAFSKTVMENYVDQFVTQGQQDGNLKKSFDFIFPYIQSMDLKSCLSDCSTNEQTLGTKDSFTQLFTNKLLALGVDANSIAGVPFQTWLSNEYDQLKAYCDAMQATCAVSSASAPCDQYESAMLQDVSPGGQYALFDNTTGAALEPQINVISNNWRTVFPVKASTDSAYIAEEITLPDGTVTSPYDSAFTLLQLVQYWKDSWAEKFLPFHPESCKLQFCQNNATYEAWDQQVQDNVTTAAAIPTIQGASGGLHYDYTNAAWLVAADPFFKSGGAGAAYSTDFQNDLQNYSRNVGNYTAASPKDLVQLIDYMLYCADPAANTNAQNDPNGTNWDNCTPSAACRVPDREWSLYKEFYFDLKQKYYDKLRATTTCANQCQIGTPITILNNSSCPANTDFSINTYSSADGTPTVTCTPPVVTPPDPGDGGPLDAAKNAGKTLTGNNLVKSQGGQGKLASSNLAGASMINSGKPANTKAATVSANKSLAGRTLADGGSGTITAPNSGTTLMTVTCNTGKLAAATTVTVGTADGSYQTVLQFPQGSIMQNFCLPANLPPQSIVVLSVVCTGCQANPLVFSAWTNNQIVQKTYDAGNTVTSTSTITPDNSSFFNGTLSINQDNTFNVVSPLHNYTGTWSIDDNCHMALIGNNRVVYTVYSVNSSQMALGHREGSIEEIWNFNSLASGVTCSSPVTLQVAGNQGSNAYLSGTYPSRHLLTVLSGTAGSPPAFTGQNAAGQTVTTTSTFYSCLTIQTASGTSINYQNVWVFDNVYDTAASTCSAALLTKIPRFPDYTIPSNAGSSAATTPQQALNQMSAQATASVTSAADSWIAALNAGLVQGNYDQTTINTLKAKLIEVASMGGDFNHPFGASTTPPGKVTASGYTSFGDAIKGVLGLSNFTSLLNPWLISSPYPYSPAMQTGPRSISNSTADICSLLTQFQSACNSYNSAHGTSLTLFAYLSQTYGSAMTLTSNDLTVLQNSCNQCRFILASDVTLPPFLDPTGHGCIAKSDYDAAKTDFTNQFAGTLTTGDPNYENIFTTFMNQRWGLTLYYTQYQDYETALITNSAAMLCNQAAPTFNVDLFSCITEQEAAAVGNGLNDYSVYINQQRELFRASYASTCSAAKAAATLNAPQQIYHYTLYYYDQADNLVRTIPPEGVTLLSDADVARVEAVRNNDASACTYTGPTTNSDKTAALISLSGTLAGSTGAVEMWLYDDGSINNQFIEATPDNKYLMQVVISGTQLGVDVYPLTSSGSNNITLASGSTHYRADISAMVPLRPFTHFVFQGSSLGSSGTAQIYLNGVALTVTHTNTTIGPGFSITTDPSGNILMPDNLATIKHLRLYSQPLSTAVITANATNTCFMPANTPDIGWFRFNVPVAGGPTTIADNSTNETQLINVYPVHGLQTNYAYNATNQVTTLQSPDGGTNRFWYDLMSRLNISQNDRQLASQNYSYTTYDILGRAIEVGEKNQQAVNLGVPDYLADATITSFNATGTNSQVTHTYYDAAAPATNGIQSITTQNNLHKRVAATTYQNTGTGVVKQATYYDYDIDGNVKTLYQQISGLGLKQINYEYDLISGKVNFVGYQTGQADQFYYQYNYDADNRITEAWSSPVANVVSYGVGSTLDQTQKRMDASYQYYLHGPLARMELGDINAKVQGVDYAYTLQGWLKGVNSTVTGSTTDMGTDGTNNIGQDAYGYGLYYYANDYKPINTAKQPFETGVPTISTFKPLYNSNISAVSMNIPQLGSQFYYHTYQYDQLNRIASTAEYTATGAGLSSLAATQNYKESFTLDGNGNILSSVRNGNTSNGKPLTMDNLTYNYNRDANGKLINNMLNSVNDSATPSTGYVGDMRNQSTNNYTYDAIGNITADVQAGVSNINWSVYGKIQSQTNAQGTIFYTYDPAQYRVAKTSGGVTTYYVRDAQGHTLAVYDNKNSQINWREQHLYGSNRIGMWMPNMNLADNNATAIWSTLGLKQYELNNYLGNVMVTLTDKRIAHSTDGTTIDYYQPDVITAQEYYAFGSLMPDLTYAANNSYRYGFNGKENDNDVKGTGNEQDYGMRIYDPRVGKFLSVDPLSAKYPELTPYQFASNSPIWLIDIDGNEGGIPIDYSTGSKGYNAFQPLSAAGVDQAFKQTTKQSLSKSVVTESGELVMEEEAERRGGSIILGTLGKAFGLTAYLVFSSNNTGIDTKPPYQRITTKPEQLSAFEIHQIKERLSRGAGTPQDLLYAPYLKERYPNSKFSQLVGKDPSSSVLAFNLIAAGFIRPDNTAAHHIVAGEAKGAALARMILKREGIDINEADNGVFLPKNSKYENLPIMTHSTIHTNKYYQAINNRLLNAKPGTVRQELHKIKQEILNGTFPK